MSKRRSAGTSGRGAGWLLGVGVVVVSAVGGVLWMLLDDAPAGIPGEASSAVVSGGGARSVETPMIVPDGVEREASRIEVPDATPVARAPAEDSPRPVATRRVSGHILRLADHSPVTDAPLSADESRSTRTDAEDGGFALRVAEGDANLQLALGRRRFVVKLPSDAGDLEDLELVVDTGWIVPGVVRTILGEPVTTAQVTSAGITVACDAAGRFRLMDVLPDSGSPTRPIRASAPMYESREITAPLPAGQRVAPPVVIRLRGAGALEGWVHPPPGSELPRAAPVRLILSLVSSKVNSASRLLEAAIEEDGHYRIDGIPAGRYLAEVGKPPIDVGRFRALRALGYLDSPDEGSVDDGFGTPLLWVPDILITEGEVTRLDVHLPAGGAATGRVTDAAGNPLVGAKVEAVRRQIWAGARATGNMTMTLGDTLVTVGDPVPGEVALTAPVASAVTDERGAFDLWGLPPGDVALRAEHDDRPGWRATERVLTVVSGVRSTGVDLALGEGRRVRGRVFDVKGQPAVDAKVAIVHKGDPATAHPLLLGAQVVMHKDGIRLGSDGSFDLAGLPDGELVLLVTLPEHQTQLHDVAPSNHDLRIDLVAAPVFRVVVTDARSGEPVDSFHVRVRGHGLTMNNQLSPEDGRFTVDGLEQKVYRIVIQASGYRPGVIEEARPSFDGVEQVVRLVPRR